MDHATLEVVDDIASSAPAGNEKLRIYELWPPKVEQSVAVLICSEQEVATDLRGVPGLRFLLGRDSNAVSKASGPARADLGLPPSR